MRSVGLCVFLLLETLFAITTNIHTDTISYSLLLIWSVPFTDHFYFIDKIHWFHSSIGNKRKKNNSFVYLYCYFLQLSFQMWTGQIQETLNSKKRGDAAFRSKEFSTAIDCYTQVRIFPKHFQVLLYQYMYSLNTTTQTYLCLLYVTISLAFVSS